MDVWGWNPSTIQVAVSGGVGLLTVFALLFAAYAAVQSKTAAEAAHKAAEVAITEAALRTRPWLGLTGFRYESDFSATGEDSLVILYRNIGPLPAAHVQIRIVMTPGQTYQATIFERSMGTAFPDDSSTVEVESIGLAKCRLDEIEVHFEGEFTYQFGDSTYLTKFEGSIEFYGKPIYWTHTEVT